MEMSSIDSSDVTRLSTSQFVPNTSLEPINQRRLLDRKNKRTLLTNRIDEAVSETKNSMNLLNRSLDVDQMKKSHDSFNVGSYKIPTNDYLWKKTPAYRISRAKVGSYMDQHAQSLKHVPCSTKYSKLGVWGHRYKGKFRREKRVTMSQHYMEQSPKIPASNQYKTERRYKIQGNYTS